MESVQLLPKMRWIESVQTGISSKDKTYIEPKAKTATTEHFVLNGILALQTNETGSKASSQSAMTLRIRLMYVGIVASLVFVQTPDITWGFVYRYQ